MAKATLEIEMKANTQGAVQNLKATQANINRVADTFVKLENSGVGIENLSRTLMGFNELIGRLAQSMYESGDAADIFDARMKVIDKALASVTQMHGGDMTKIAEQLREWSDNAGKASEGIQALTSSTEELKDTEKEAMKVTEKHGSKLLDVAKNIFKFQLLMPPITSAIRTFKQTLSDSIKVAAEAEQVYSKLSTVFDGMTTSLEKADTLAKKIGTSTSTAAGALSTVGDLLQAQGMTVAESMETATEWVEKFADIIAFKDIDMSLEEFAQNFMSGAAGNLRNFRTFGSIVKESAVNARLAQDGYDKLTGSQLELQKMVTRATLALEQQKNSVGATDKEWESMLSIQRRMEEQTKRLKENLGEYLNTGLKPVESAWEYILSDINKSIEAQKELNKLTAEGGSGDGFWSTLANNAWDKTFGASGSYQSQAMKYAPEYDKATKSRNWTDQQIKDLVSIGRDTYGFDLEQIKKLLGSLGAVSISADKVDKAFKSLAEDDADKLYKETINAEKERIKSVYEAFVESITSLGLHTYGNAPTNMEDLRYYVEIDLEDIFDEMSTSSLSDFADQLSVALGDNYTVDALKAQQTVWKSIYETARNFFITNNENHELTEDNLKFLDLIKAKYQGINGLIDAANLKLQNQQKLEAILASTIGGTDYRDSRMGNIQSRSWESQKDDLRGGSFYSEEHFKAYYSWYKKYQEALALAGDDESKQADLLAKAKTEVMEMSLYYKDLAKDAEKTAKAEKLSAQKQTTKDYQTQLRQLDMTDAQKVIDDLMSTFSETTDTDLRDAIKDTIKAYNELSEATSKKAAEEERAKTIADINSGTTDWVKKAGQVGLDDYTIKLMEFQSKLRVYDPDEGRETADEELYQATMDQMDAFVLYTAEVKKATEIQEKLNEAKKYEEKTADYQKQLDQIDMTDAEKTLADLNEALGKAGKGTDLEASIQATIDAFKKLQTATDALKSSEKNKADRDKLVDTSKNATDNYKLQLRQLGMTDDEKTLDNFKIRLQEAADAMDKDLYKSIMEEKNAFIELKDATDKLTKQQEMASSFKAAGGEFGSMIDSFSGDAFSAEMDGVASTINSLGAAAGPVGYLFEELLKIVSSLDVVNEIMSLLSDSLTPVFNDFLEPLLPVIKTLGSILSHILEITLLKYYPVLQKLSEILLFVVGCIDIVVQAIDDSMKWIIGNVQKVFYDIVNGIIDIVNKIPFVNIGHVSSGSAEEWASTDVLGNIENNWNDLMNELQKIEDNTFGTWKNTDKENDSIFDAYTDMFSSGLINLSEYNGLLTNLSGANYDRVNTYGNLSWQNGSNGTTTAYYGGITININGSNLSASEVESAVRAGVANW